MKRTPPSSPGGSTVQTHRLDVHTASNNNRCCTWVILIGTFMLLSGASIFGWLQIPGLNTQIQRLNAEVKRLEGQVDRLEEQNDRFEDSNDRLNTTVGNLQRVNEELGNSTAHLEILVLELNQSWAELNHLANDLANENDRFESINEDLFTVVSFLNSTTFESLETIVAFLEQQIKLQQSLVLRSLETSYQTSLTSWDCGLRGRFPGASFVEDETQPIGDAWPSILNYVDGRVLQSWCLDRADYERFMRADESFSLASIVSRTGDYLQAAVNYYFRGEVSADEWAQANFECSGITPFVF